jgi:hypothetical protein
MNSGDSTVPTIRRSRHLPLITAPTVSPGSRSCALANASSTATSSAWSANGNLPVLRYTRQRAGSPARGSEITRAAAGSLIPRTSRTTSRTIRVSTRETPGTSASRSASESGARFSSANTCGNPDRS